jgi:hypothetical protein
MPDPDLRRRLLGYLAAHGPATGADAAKQLGVSQPVFSRLVGSLRDQVLVIGRARATRYAVRRSIDTIGGRVTVYEIDDSGSSRRAAALHCVSPDAFYVESLCEDMSSELFSDLPYFLDGMRPAGFLGRGIKALHPELDLPGDVRLWSADHTLKYLARYGWNMPGSFVVGDEAFALFLNNAQAPPDAVEAKQRRRRYPQMADQALAGSVGSSAGGEHPKFLASRLPGPVSVLVKFSPPMENEVARRIADLLVCELIAHRVMAEHGQMAPPSETLLAANRLFLEVERFDRVGPGGRRGVISLLALDAQFVGRMKSWSDSAAELARMRIIDADALEATRWRELFGALIGNTDMHPANLSFLASGARVLGIAPCYDMLPMLYSPQHGHVMAPEFRPPAPLPDHSGHWDAVSRAAADFWEEAGSHALISDDFRAIACENRRLIDEWRKIARRLPR